MTEARGTLRAQPEHLADLPHERPHEYLEDPGGDPGSGGRGDSRLVTDSLIRPSFTLEQIRTFLAVASRQHVTNAAKMLGLTQPAVSQQVQMLERALGIPLVERSGRGIRLTDAGLDVAGTCLLIMRSIESLERVAEELRGLGRGSLEIGASQVTANYYLFRALAAFTAAHPTININLRVSDTENVCDRVASGQLHCGMVDGPLPKTSLLCTSVGTDEVILVAQKSNPLACADKVHNHQLRTVRYLVWGPTSATEAIAAEMLGPLHRRLAKIRLPGLEAARQALLADNSYIAAMPHVAVAAALESGALARLRVRAKNRPICAVRRGGPAGPCLEAFWRELAAVSGPGLRPGHGAGSHARGNGRG